MRKTPNTLVRFDWAIKRLLRNKADYCVVEGLLTVLLGREIKIESLLESESNKENAENKYNRVDVLAKDTDGELIIFEIQNNREFDYFQRMAYGTSKVISEYLKKGAPYKQISKVYSINIVYFSLGQGDDYAYHGTTQFVSMHNPNDILQLSEAQRKTFDCETPADIFPEYYLLRVDKFDDVAKTPLDEWINFLKYGEIPPNVTAPGLLEARERLRIDSLSEEERINYDRMMDDLSYQASVIDTGRIEGREQGLKEGYSKGKKEGIKEGLAKGREESTIQNAKKILDSGMMTIDQIAQILKLTDQDIKKITEK